MRVWVVYLSEREREKSFILRERVTFHLRAREHGCLEGYRYMYWRDGGKEFNDFREITDRGNGVWIKCRVEI